MSAAEEVLAPYVPIVHEVDLPFPVPINSLYGYGRGRVYKSARAKKWIIAANNLWLSQKRGIPRRIETICDGIVWLAEGAGWGDSDAYFKIVFDWAQNVGLVRNDNLIKHPEAIWVDAFKAPAGCKLILREIA